MTNQDPTAQKSNERAALEEAVAKSWNKHPGMYCTTVFMWDPSTKTASPMNSMEFCGGHKTLDEAMVCMEKALPLILDKLGRDKKLLNEIGKVAERMLGIPFNPKKDLNQPFVCVTKTDCTIVEFASG